jgi:hypothetical protein
LLCLLISINYLKKKGVQIIKKRMLCPISRTTSLKSSIDLHNSEHLNTKSSIHLCHGCTQKKNYMENDYTSMPSPIFLNTIKSL